MFGGLTKTSSRIAIAAALGMTLGGFAMGANTAKAADLGGDCCADLEERVAELEATTVRKGNKKVSVTLSGWVTKSVNFWDDGEESNIYVGDKGTTLSSHFQISGSATISPGWSGGYTMSVEAPGTAFGFGSNQFVPGDDDGFQHIDTLLSYMWIKSDKWGTLNWGLLSQATDNVALLPDLSGTIIESNAVMFEGVGFHLRAKGLATNESGLANGIWGTFLFCQTAEAGIGADCNGVPYNAVRYDSPTFGGFSVSTSWGEDDIGDVALKYAADWNSIKVSAAAGYSQSTDERYVSGGGGLANVKQDAKLFQVGASVLHVPSGLFVYGLYQNENANPNSVRCQSLQQWRGGRQPERHLVRQDRYQADLVGGGCNRSLRRVCAIQQHVRRREIRRCMQRRLAEPGWPEWRYLSGLRYERNRFGFCNRLGSEALGRGRGPGDQLRSHARLRTVAAS